jgi:hypothetical protein
MPPATVLPVAWPGTTEPDSALDIFMHEGFAFWPD